MSARTPTPPEKPLTWIAYLIRGAKAARLGHVEARTMEAAIAAAAEEHRVDPKRVLVQQVRYA